MGKGGMTMDDLISRNAVRDGMMKYGFQAPDMTVHEFVEDELPSVPAVPLDKLCEYLNSVIYPCIICKESPGSQCNAKREGCWERVLTKWMEGLDGSVSMAQKT
jgi:hypothetical protein